jgi:hypothetical protein
LPAFERIATQLDIPAPVLARGWILEALAIAETDTARSAIDRVEADLQRLSTPSGRIPFQTARHRWLLERCLVRGSGCLRVTAAGRVTVETCRRHEHQSAEARIVLPSQ